MISRRTFLRGLLATTATAGMTGLYTFRLEPRWVQIAERPLPIHNLPRALAGRTLVQFSDLHIGDQYDWRYQQDVYRRVQALAPDFVVYTGDFVSYDTDRQLDQLHHVVPDLPLGSLGTAAVLGNHDYGHGWRQHRVGDDIAAMLTAAGVRVLRNEAHDFAGLTIAGLDDFWSPNFNPRALRPTLDGDGATILLCHNPDVADRPVWGNFRGWMLSGHTHGGQVKPPFLPPPLLPVQNKRYTSGEFALGNGRFLYINRGLGNIMSVRFNARPEVTLFTLVAA